MNQKRITYQLETIEEDFNIILIHSTFEDYKLAYILNGEFKTRFIRERASVPYIDTLTPVYHYNNQQTNLTFSLISNRQQVRLRNSMELTLFDDTINYGIHYILPEFKNVDYLLKIEGASSDTYTPQLLTKLESLTSIANCYVSTSKNLKSKENLAFQIP